MKLLLGTTNPAKIVDYKKYLVHDKLDIVTLQDVGFIDEPLEIGKTFDENSLQKAKYYAEKTEYATLADDGGFEVDALDRRPGVESNRWLGPSSTDQDKIDKVLELLKGIPEGKRTARLRAVATAYFPDVKDHVSSEGVIEGVVPLSGQGRLIPKFPYRSVLFIPSKNKFYSDFTSEELEDVADFDHRKKICKELLLKLEPYINA